MAGNKAKRALTVPDRLGPGLDIVSIGINPSIYTAEKGYNFARPGNRFWPTLKAAGIVPPEIEPGIAAVQFLFHDYRIGFTNIVSRATARADELSAEDYRRGALALRRKLLKHQPLIAWFQGVSAFQAFLEHAEGIKRKVRPGLQQETLGETKFFVSPNPSGANPAANPKVLLPWYLALRQLRDSLAAKTGPAAQTSARRSAGTARS